MLAVIILSKKRTQLDLQIKTRHILYYKEWRNRNLKLASFDKDVTMHNPTLTNPLKLIWTMRLTLNLSKSFQETCITASHHFCFLQAFGIVGPTFVSLVPSHHCYLAESLTIGKMSALYPTPYSDLFVGIRQPRRTIFGRYIAGLLQFDLGCYQTSVLILSSLLFPWEKILPNCT